jgi:hypothetical protein
MKTKIAIAAVFLMVLFLTNSIPVSAYTVIDNEDFMTENYSAYNFMEYLDICYFVSE